MIRKPILLGVLLVAGCAGTTPPNGTPPSPATTAPSKCAVLSPAMLDTIAEGLTYDDVELTRGAAVRLPKAERRLGINYAVAVEAKGDGGTEHLILGAGSPDDGPIIASDHVARLYFTWGASARDGSPMGDLRDTLFVLDAAADAERCL